MRTVAILIISICSMTSIVSTPGLGAEVYDDFNGSQINTTRWVIDNSDGVLSQSGGLLNAEAPPYLTGGAVWSKTYFYGDLEVILDWRDFSVSDPGGLTTYHQFGLNITDSANVDNQAHIVRGYGSSPPGWIFSSIWQDGESLDYRHVFGVSAASGLFKIARVGSTISLYYDIGGG